VERAVEDGASVRGAVFTTGACKVAGMVKTTRKVDFEINPIDEKKKKKKKGRPQNAAPRNEDNVYLLPGIRRSGGPTSCTGRTKQSRDEARRLESGSYAHRRRRTLI
jgi:hypothetical protein